MLIPKAPLHDVKSERADVPPPLPGALRIVPIVFYLAIVGGIAVTALLLFQLGDATPQLTGYTYTVNATRSELAEVKKQRRAIEAEARRASDVSAWIQGTRQLQPLLVNINRSIEGRNGLAEIKLTRNNANPAQILLDLKLNSESGRQLDRTLESIYEQNYRTYSAQQSAGPSGLDYKATLIYQGDSALPADTDEEPSSPQPAESAPRQGESL